MKSSLLFSIVVTAILTLSCGKSAKADRHLVDSLERRVPELIMAYDFEEDSSAIKEAIGIIDRLLAMKPDNFTYKAEKIQLLVYDGQYDLAGTMIVNEDFVGRIYPDDFFPGYEDLLLANLDALKANDAGDQAGVSQSLDRMQRILKDWIFSEHFDFKDFCDNMSSDSQSIIFKEAMFLKWLNVLYTQGGNEAVQQELRRVINDYGVADQLNTFTQDTYGYTTVLQPHIFM